MTDLDYRLYETHCHTPLCKHAIGEPVEYAEEAMARGLAGVIVTCHGPLPDGISSSVRMAPEQFPAYVELVAEATRKYEGRVDVRLGLESDYLPGLESWVEKLHDQAEFHYILGSVHPHIREYRDKYFTGNWPDFHKGYYGHLAMAAESGLYDCLSHPDIVKNLGSEAWDIEALMPDICRSLDRIAATGIAMELNTSGLYKAVTEMNPGPRILRAMHERGIPVVIGADAHVPSRVGDCFREAIDVLREAGYTEVNYFLDRKRRSVPILEARKTLK